MGIQSFTPSGGGGTPGFDYINSINMITYNRSWAQSGAAGNYVLNSHNKNSGYAYFVGSGVTTGIPLGYVAVVNHAFTSINIVAPTNDYISLFKASVKSTTLFANALDGFSSFPSIINSSGNFVLPNNALPLINVLLVGGGGASGAGHGGAHGGGGGGGGGGIVNLTAYQAVGTTSVTVGAGGLKPSNIFGVSHSGGPGNKTFFGNVYAIGGGGGVGWSAGDKTLFAGANSGGGGNGSSGATHNAGNISPAQTASTGLGITGSPTYIGGYAGGNGHTSNGTSGRGGGGGGAGGNGSNGATNSGGDGGAGHVSSITGSSYQYAAGGGGYNVNNNHGSNPNSGGYGVGAHGSDNAPDSSDQVQGRAGNAGVVVVRYYIP